MKKFSVFLMVVYYSTTISLSYGYSDPTTWSKKKETVINLTTDFIANREKFSPTCYKDGYDPRNKKWKYSLGYGTAQTVKKENWCDAHIKKLKQENKFLALMPDALVRRKVVVNEKVARWKVKEFVISIYDNLEKPLNGQIPSTLDEIELVAVISFVYTIGETAFYTKSSLFKEHLPSYVKTKKMRCLAVRRALLDWSKVKTTKGLVESKGAYNRREVEMTMFTHRNCVF